MEFDLAVMKNHGKIMRIVLCKNSGNPAIHFLLLAQPLKKNRPKAHVYQRAICKNATEVEIVVNGAVGGIRSEMNKAHREHWKLDQLQTVKVWMRMLALNLHPTAMSC